MKKLATYCLLFVLVTWPLYSPSVRAQSPPTATQGPEAQRSERLAALGKVWGTVKFFHPYLAYRKIDWDGALISTIPKVNAAKTPEEYRDAINEMLSVLHDPNTFAQLKPSEMHVASTAADAPTPSTDKDAMAKYSKIVDGVLIIDVGSVVRDALRDRDSYYSNIREISIASAKQKAVVWDLRIDKPADASTADSESYLFSTFAAANFRSVIGVLVTLAASRYRLHNGYTPQDGQNTGGYYSALLSTAPENYTPRAQGKRSLSVIINRYTPDLGDKLSGMQAANAATVIQEGPIDKEFGAGAYSLDLSDGVQLKMRTAELVNPDGSVGFRPDLKLPARTGEGTDAAMLAAINTARQPVVHAKSAPDSANSSGLQTFLDDPYAKMEFPDTGYRLMALFRFWNVINFFFPYKNLIGEPWENILTRYIPQFEANRDALDYQRTVTEMVTTIHDSHGYIGGTERLQESLGMFFPPVSTRLVEGQTTVRTVNETSSAAGLKVGDVVSTIDGEPAVQRSERFGKLIAASTPQGLAVESHDYFLRGAKDSKVLLVVKGADSKPRQVELTRSLGLQDYAQEFFRAKAAQPVFTVLPTGFGYIDLTRLTLPDVHKALSTVMNTPAVIFDVRGYPNGTAWSIAPRLTTRRNIVGALFRRNIVQANTLGATDYAQGTEFGFSQELPAPEGKPYLGKVVMLINAEAISQAEHTCLFFESATNVTFVGTPTVGANGDTTGMVLPGGIYAYFSGAEVRHADGRQLQRLGIQPDIKVAPTIKGIRAGRDEILEAAIKYLQQKPK